MRWPELLYHDHTPYYTTATEADIGERVTVRLRAPGAAPIRRAFLVVLEGGEARNVEMRSLPATGPWRHFEAELPLVEPRTRYAFSVLTGSDTVQLTTRGARRFTAPYRDWFQFLAGHRRPSWLEDRVFYQVFVDRFRNGDPGNDVRNGEYLYEGRPVLARPWDTLPTREGDVHEHFGGDLDGVREGLPYLERLGANGLYLTPVFSSPSNHRYDTADYNVVDPHLGGEAALRRLLDAAHARGFKVVLDGVFNHTGSEHADFRAALGGGGRELFTFDEAGEYRAFFGVPTLPKIDYRAEAAFERFLEGPDSPVRRWLRFGADGWRLDVAHMIGAGGGDEENLAVHRRLRAAAALENPDAYVFGERYYDAEAALQGGGEDGVMNYHGFYHPVMDWLSGQRAWTSSVRLGGADVAEVLLESWRVLPPPQRAGQYNLIGSHDVPRALHRLGEDKARLRVALALLLAHPGVPGLYYGDEVGLSGGGTPFNRAPFPWDEGRQDAALLEDVRALVAARRGSRALQAGGLVWLHAGRDAIAHARPYAHRDGRVEVALCAASRRNAGRLSLDLAPAGVSEGRWGDALSGEVLEARGGRLALDLAAPRLLVPLLEG